MLDTNFNPAKLVLLNHVPLTMTPHFYRVCSEYAIPLPGLPYPFHFPLVLKANLKSLFPLQSLLTKTACGNHFSTSFCIALQLKL